MIEARHIKDRDEWLKWREQDMTASVGACLFGADVHPYTSAYQQWAFKSGLAKPKPIDPKLARRAFYVEMIAPAILKEERPTWRVETNHEYFRDPEARIGATPDFLVQRENLGLGLVDAKSLGNGAFRRWRDQDTGNTELPVWMAVQVNIQAGLLNEHLGIPIFWGAVLAVTIDDGGLDAEIFNVPIERGLFANFRELAKDFWRRVEMQEPYPIDWGKDTGVVLDMYRDDDASVIDLSNDEALETFLVHRESYKQIEASGIEAEKSRKLLDAMIIHKLGNHARARTKGGLIEAKVVRVKEAIRKAYTYPKLTIKGYEARDNFLTDATE
jgi:hypothetical protein